ncbi:MAG: 16S rRNA (uracil(1498)-N(3))-methyltransferase [Cytophagales bacterium]|nr:16S rRNA (uracil(1498)-N(3))-methyltransferase [Cytophagales bacterium]
MLKVESWNDVWEFGIKIRILHDYFNNEALKLYLRNICAHTMQLFYAEIEKDGKLFLGEDESAHCIRILRHGLGDMLQVTDGHGNLYSGELIKDHPKKAEISILSKIENYGKRPYRLQVALAPTKSADRTEWFVEKSIELGIDEITFIYTQRTERKHINLDRIQKIGVSAMKQSGQAKLPIFKDASFPSWVSQTIAKEKFIAWLPETPPTSLILQAAPKSDSLVLIGPEGDFTAKETELAMKSGFLPVSLGPTRLRTETAGVYVAALYNQINIV